MLAPSSSMEFESDILPNGNPDSGKKHHALGFGALAARGADMPDNTLEASGRRAETQSEQLGSHCV